MTPASIDAGDLQPEAVHRALFDGGGFLLVGALDEAMVHGVLAAARDFFALPASIKQAVAIERSPHFRGWSEMHNARDWREQVHLGRELPPAGDDPRYLLLEGPNPWPPDPAWRAVILAYMRAVAEVGQRVLAAIAEGLGVERAAFASVAEEGYLLTKLIGYHPQEGVEARREGVAPHVDFSWITLTIQDRSGLSIRRPDGVWVDVDPRDGAIWVHPGEILELATGGLYFATPHRVINPSSDRTRVSIPTFINPPLRAEVPIFPVPEALRAGHAAPAGGHVHRVIAPGAPPAPMSFGEAEWRRKGLDGWCAECSLPREDSVTRSRS